MSCETLHLFDDLPMDNPPEPKKMKPVESNRFCKNFKKYLGIRKKSLADIEREAYERGVRIPWSTLMSWRDGLSRAQIADQRVKVIADILNVSLEQLLFGAEEEDENGGAY